MNHEKLEVSVNLMNEKVRFSTSLRENPPVVTDYTPPIGDGQGYTSLELFLISLATCSGTSVVSMLRKMRRNVSSFRVNAQGIRRDQHPLSFQKIFLEFVIHSNDAESDDIRKAIKLSEDTYCPVWAMIKGNVEVISEYRLVME